MNIDKFRKLFPEFENNTDKQIEMYYEIAQEYIKKSASLTDTKREYALNLMTAHLLAQGNNTMNGNTQTGQTASASQGSVSVSFQTFQAKGAFQHWLSLTPYGLQVLALFKTLSVGGFYIGGVNPAELSAVQRANGGYVYGL